MKQFFQTGKPILKITAAVLLVLAAASLVGAATYAWHILSVAPEAGGMQITVGAAKVIQVAPDVTAAGSHVPGTFGDTLDITKDANYDYLNGLAGLTPVSTADGVHWYLPQYGDAADGMEGPTAFTEDQNLAHANLPAEQAAAAQEGSYYYMDFWVSAPEDYNLRLAAGDSKSAGSYALTLPLPQKSAEGGVSLSYDDAGLAAQKCLRLGFLTGLDSDEGTSFLIYEPNGTDGVTYTVTTPQSAVEETGDISGHLTVQQTSQWKPQLLNNAFAQFVKSADTDLLNMEALAVARQFYTKALGGQYRPYVTSGQFYQRAADLYENAASAPTSGAAADGVILRLKANEPQRIRLFVWLEGQDADCINDAQNALLGIHLELAGSNQ